MRYESCLSCKHGGIPPLHLIAAEFAEQLSPDVHHHHTVSCADCGVWWFDDVVLSALGIPVSSPRDTAPCPCPEDGRPIFTPTVILVRVPERRCRCTHDQLSRARAS